METIRMTWVVKLATQVSRKNREDYFKLHYNIYWVQ